MKTEERIFHDRIFEVVRNFVEYKKYQGKQENAIKVLVKSLPDYDPKMCTALFTDCCEAYKDAVPLVKSNITYYTNKAKKNPIPDEVAYRDKYKHIPEQLLTWTIGWVYHWYHER